MRRWPIDLHAKNSRLLKAKIRAFDIILSIIGLALLAIPLSILVLIGFVDTKSPLFFQKRLGKGKRPFYLIKLRTMKKGTPSLATHLVNFSAVTPYGGVLRKTKLDELPQLINVLMGRMSFVGPRPGLPSQDDLTREREKRSLYKVRPGITGLAQIRGVDMSQPKLLAELDEQMMSELSLGKYFKYIIQTFLGMGTRDGVVRK